MTSRPSASAGRMTRATCSAREARNSRASVAGTMSPAGSRRSERMRSPVGVPPGSRTTRCGTPRDRSSSARRVIWVVLPAPSGPSKTSSRPAITSAQGDDRAGCALLHSLEDPGVHAGHGLVEVLLGDDEPLVGIVRLDDTEEVVQLMLHLLGRLLPALDHRVRIRANLLHLLE